MININLYARYLNYHNCAEIEFIIDKKVNVSIVLDIEELKEIKQLVDEYLNIEKGNIRNGSIR